MSKIQTIVIGVIIIVGLVVNALNFEKSTPAPISKCQVEIDDLNYQLNQCKMIRGQ